MRMVQETRRINPYRRSKPGKDHTRKTVQVSGHSKSVTIKRLSKQERDNIMAGRSRRAVSQDMRKRGRIPVNDTTWGDHPGRYDLEGVDTPEGGTPLEKVEDEFYSRVSIDAEQERIDKERLDASIKAHGMSMEEFIEDSTEMYQETKKPEMKASPEPKKTRDPWAVRDRSKMTAEELKIDDAIREIYPGEEYSWYDPEDGDILVKILGKNGAVMPHYKSNLERVKTDQPPRLVQASMKDVNADLASMAHRGTSFHQEARGVAERQGYVSTVNDFNDEMQQKVPKEEHDALKQDLEEYRKWEIRKHEENLSSHSGLVSSFIAGPSNFPARQQNKRGDAYHNKMQKYFDAQAKYQKRLKRKYGLMRGGAVSSDDADATQKLQAKIDSRKKHQEHMKAVNQIARSKKTTEEQKIEQMKEHGIDQFVAKKMLHPEYNYQSPGYESWELSNNNANIKRMEERMKDIDKRKGATTSEEKMKNGYVVRNVEANRLQLHFDSKPDENTRRELKSRGFKWAPSQDAWQRQLNSNAEFSFGLLKDKGVI